MKSYGICFLLIYLSLIHKGSSNAQDKPCRYKNFGYDSTVCVCDEDYCDNANPRMPKSGEYVLVATNKDGLRFSTVRGSIRPPTHCYGQTCCDVIDERKAFLTVDRTKTGQEILGFGTTFTDAVGYNLNKVSEKLRNQTINAFYSSEGLKYNMARTTIAHSDFSLSEYYNDDTPYDTEMIDWELKYEDYNYRLNYIKMAKAVADDVYLLSSIWTVPSWMREDSDIGKMIQVKEEYYDAMALYIIRYLQAVKKEGIDVWGISYINEPTVSLGVPIDEDVEKIMTSWTINRLAKYAMNHFKPALEKEFPDVKILHFDDNRNILLATTILYLENDTDLLQKAEYIALHSYLNQQISTKVVEDFHKKYPNITIINTEYCVFGKNKLGSWNTAESYVTNILEEMNLHTSAWIEWNMLLDMDSGPTFINNFVDSTVVLDTEKGLFYKQPSYYAMGHFSKFMPRGSFYIDMKPTYPTSLKHAAVLRPDGLVAAVLYNPTNNSITTSINDSQGSINVIVSPNSINTIIF